MISSIANTNNSIFIQPNSLKYCYLALLILFIKYSNLVQTIRPQLYGSK